MRMMGVRVQVQAILQSLSHLIGLTKQTILCRVGEEKDRPAATKRRTQTGAVAAGARTLSPLAVSPPPLPFETTTCPLCSVHLAVSQSVSQSINVGHCPSCILLWLPYIVAVKEEARPCCSSGRRRRRWDPGLAFAVWHRWQQQQHQQQQQPRKSSVSLKALLLAQARALPCCC